MTRLPLLAALVLLFVACDAAADVAPRRPSQPAVDGALIADVQPLDDSGVSGRVVVADAAGGTTVMADLEGLASGRYAGVIRSGGCAEAGPERVDFDPLEVDESRVASATTTIERPSVADLDEGHSYVVHVLVDGERGEAIACGDLVVATGMLVARPSGEGGESPGFVMLVGLPAANGEAESALLAVDVGLSEGRYAQHLHLGSCEDRDDPAIELPELAVVDRPRTLVLAVPDLAMSDVAAGYVYDLHTTVRGDGTDGSWCGPLGAPP